MDRLRDYFKCYDPKFLAWTWAGVAVLLVASFAGIAFPRGSLPRFACAAIQALAMGPLIVMAVLRTRHLDELQRKIQLESIAVAFAFGAAVMTAWGYFEHAGAPRADWGLWSWPMFMLAYAVAFFVTRRRYR